MLLNNVKGAIDPDSTIDSTGLPHFIALPDLALFSNRNFPFDRPADLSETAVIVPDKPGAEDDSTYLTLMGRMGESTGYAATGMAGERSVGCRQVGRPRPPGNRYHAEPAVLHERIPVSLASDEKRFSLSGVVSTVMD